MKVGAVMKVVNVSQMRGLEQAAIEDCGVPSLLLMENAMG